MNLREIILDFTSLLDVIMIILFWFILNYHNQTAQIRQQAEQTIMEAQQLASDAQQQMTDAEALSEQSAQQAEEAESLYTEAMQKLDAMDGTAQGSNIQAILDFDQNETVIINLVMKDDGWRLNVCKGEERIGQVSDEQPQKVGMELNSIFQEAGYGLTDTMLCVFLYDSSEAGTKEAYETIMEAFRQIKIGNSHFYVTEIDTLREE